MFPSFHKTSANYRPIVFQQTSPSTNNKPTRPIRRQRIPTTKIDPEVERRIDTIFENTAFTVKPGITLRKM